MFRELLERDHAEIDLLYQDVVKHFDAGIRDTVIERLDLFWARLAVHIRAEHLHLFPAVLRSNARTLSEGKELVPDLVSVIAQLRRDHNGFMYELAGAIKALRAVAADDQKLALVLKDVRERLMVVKQNLDRHNRLEEERIYALEEISMSSEDHSQLYQLISRELANMPSRFAKNVGANTWAKQ